VSNFDEAAFKAALANVPPTVLASYLEHLAARPSLVRVLIQETTRDYAGEGLDAQLAEFSQHRLPNESDWNFRKRTFPAVFAQNEEEAIRIILTCPHTLITSMHASLLATLAQDTSPAGLRRWADGWGTDPYRTYHPTLT